MGCVFGCVLLAGGVGGGVVVDAVSRIFTTAVSRGI